MAFFCKNILSIIVDVSYFVRKRMGQTGVFALRKNKLSRFRKEGRAKRREIEKRNLGWQTQPLRLQSTNKR